MESEVTTLFPPMFPSEHLDSVEIVFREIGAGSKWRAVVETDFKLDVLLALIREHEREDESTEFTLLIGNEYTSSQQSNVTVADSLNSLANGESAVTVAYYRSQGVNLCSELEARYQCDDCFVYLPSAKSETDECGKCGGKLSVLEDIEESNNDDDSEEEESGADDYTIIPHLVAEAKTNEHDLVRGPQACDDPNCPLRYGSAKPAKEATQDHTCQLRGQRHAFPGIDGYLEEKEENGTLCTSELTATCTCDEGCPLLLLSEDDKMCYKEDGVLLFNDEMEFEDDVTKKLNAEFDDLEEGEAFIVDVCGMNESDTVQHISKEHIEDQVIHFPITPNHVAVILKSPFLKLVNTPKPSVLDVLGSPMRKAHTSSPTCPLSPQANSGLYTSSPSRQSPRPSPSLQLQRERPSTPKQSQADLPRKRRAPLFPIL